MRQVRGYCFSTPSLFKSLRFHFLSHSSLFCLKIQVLCKTKNSYRLYILFLGENVPAKNSYREKIHNVRNESTGGVDPSLVRRVIEKYIKILKQ